VRAAAIAAALRDAECRPLPGVLPTLPRGWRNNPAVPQTAVFRAGDETVTVLYERDRSGSYRCQAGGIEHVAMILAASDAGVRLSLDGAAATYTVRRVGTVVYVQGPDGQVTLEEVPRFGEAKRQAAAGGYTAPMPGKVIAVSVSAGQAVAQGDLLVTLEAMKMEHRIVAYEDGVVEQVPVTVGDQVDLGAALVVMRNSEVGGTP
jgi:propionyl-CoA carboxylase alpha chain